MIAARNRLTLILPSLLESLGPDSDRICPLLHKLLGRASVGATKSRHHQLALMHHMGLAPESESDVPGARCTYLADFNESPPADCVRADPVHIQMERDHGHLVTPHSLSLEADQASQLVADLNTHFAGEVEIFIGQGHRWYITGLSPDGLDTVPPAFAAGRNISLLLPRADAAIAWKKLSMEVQMFLHAHPVNEERVNDGLLPINALWFWGGGTIIPSPEGIDCRLYADVAFARGLAKTIGITLFPLNEAVPLMKQAASRRPKAAKSFRSNTIVVDTTLINCLLGIGELSVEQTLAAMESGIISAAVSVLKLGRIKELVIDTCNGQSYTLTRWDLLRFWVRPWSPEPATNREMDSSALDPVGFSDSDRNQ